MWRKHENKHEKKMLIPLQKILTNAKELYFSGRSIPLKSLNRSNCYIFGVRNLFFENSRIPQNLFYKNKVNLGPSLKGTAKFTKRL